MLSNKWTFSLTSLVLILALGFAFAPVAMAVEGGPLPELSVIDVSKVDGNQVDAYDAVPATGTDQPDMADDVDTVQKIVALLDAHDNQNTDISFHIRLHTGLATLALVPAGTPAGADIDQVEGAEHLLHISDLTVAFLDRNGVDITPTDGLDEATSVIENSNPAFPDGRNFKVTIANADIPEKTRFMSVSIAADQFKHDDPRDILFGSIGLGNQPSVIHDPAKPNELGATLGKMDMSDPPVAIANPLMLQLVNADVADPDVVSILRVIDATSGGADTTATGQFGGTLVSGPFNVKVTFTEEPDFAVADVAGSTGKDFNIGALPFIVERGKITRILKGAPSYVVPSNLEGNYATATDVPDPTGRDMRYHSYLLTIEPALENADDVVIWVRSFNDLVIPPKKYEPPTNFASVSNRSVVRVSVNPAAIKKTAAVVTTDATKANREAKRTNEVFISGGLVVPSKGYLVLARGDDQAASGVKSVGAGKYKDNDKRERADNQTNIDFKYNVAYKVGFPVPADNFELFFRNGGTISLRYKDAPDSTIGINKTTGYHGSRKADVEGITDDSLVISEIMWGTDTDASNAKSQWIELHNPGDTDISIDQEEWVLRFDGPTPIINSHFDVVVDTVSNDPADADAEYWEVPGSNGRAATPLNPTESVLTSMFLKIDGGTVPADGSDPSNWMASLSRPVINLIGNRVGTPGAASGYVAEMETEMETETETETEVVEDPVPVAGATDIVITEIMYSTGRGNLPQWIELANVSTSEASLEGWEVEIDNDGADDLSITLGATTADAGQAVLLVSKNGRNSGTGDEEGDLRRIVNLKDLGVTGTLLGSTGFQVTLTPPAAAGTSVRTAGDIAGGMDWELAAMDGDRSSLIREMNADATYKDGSMRMSWHLTTGTGRYGTYYGHPSDTGTPGYAMSGPLPVELSMFYPARDKLTGQVVITWETQSELNNAGFFIKRSEAKNGKFVVINPTMIPGAGTTAEKQSYTHTDTTAKPNVLYYYQIEDVSLDGKRATLTGAHRLRGHIGAAGKLTTKWGELKAQE